MALYSTYLAPGPVRRKPDKERGKLIRVRVNRDAM